MLALQSADRLGSVPRCRRSTPVARPCRRDEWQTALSLKSDYALAYHNRGVAYAKLGKPDLAIRDYDTALLLHPTYAKGYYSKARACERANRTIEAVAAYRRFIKLSGNVKDSNVRRARKRIQILTR